MMRSKEKKFVFIHIPKTGGTTISNRLAQYALINENGRPGLHKFHIDTRLHDGIREHPSYLKWYENYLFFSFVRNPWDRLFSFYLTTRRQEIDWTLISVDDFHVFCESVRENKYRLSYFAKRTQLYQLSDKHNKLLVNNIGRFENFEDDFSRLCKKLDISEWQETGIMNQANFNNLNYRDFYTQEDRNWVSKVFRDDIQIFNYDY